MGKKFDTLFESAIKRYHGPGFLAGDQVNLKKNWSGHAWTKGLQAEKLEAFKKLAESGKLLRVYAIKSNYMQGSTQETYHPDNGYYIDIMCEEAPGLYGDKFMVPCDLLEWVDNGINRASSVPDGVKHNPNVNIKPKDLNSEEAALDPIKQTQSNADSTKADRSLPQKNVKLPGAKGAKSASYTGKYIEQ